VRASWLHCSEAELGRTGCPQRGCSCDTFRTNLNSSPTGGFRTSGALDLAQPAQHVDSTSSYRCLLSSCHYRRRLAPEAWAPRMLRLLGDACADPGHVPLCTARLPVFSTLLGRRASRVHQVGGCRTTPTSMVPAALLRPNQPSDDGQTDAQTLSGTNTMTRRRTREVLVDLACPDLPRLPQHNDRLPKGG